ncbi:unnamed protein product [Rhizophagus irregularis]|uniref:Uncharacterized protein n=1 Tax=Rhizophagus irregularis TaxID=588596 RepID=A0A916E4F7_9GLOM|nr:unnamed protein product [Rhizophagus irregularis]CAB5352432.1 unnamed protein product [Rhizophagus irregularis]
MPIRIRLKWLRTFVFLREHLPGTGFRLEDFGFLDYLGYWILSSQISASWIIWDIGFCLPGFFILASWIIWDIGVWGGFTLNKHNNFILVQINK